MVNRFRYKDVLYDNLKINWFVKGRTKPIVPFELAIIDYAQLAPTARFHPENHIKECFTLEEAELLKHYLIASQHLTAAVEEKHLPINEHERGYRDVTPVPGTDFIPLYRKQHYSLPFNVEGVFNVRMADERISPDEKITVISRLSPDAMKKLREIST